MSHRCTLAICLILLGCGTIRAAEPALPDKIVFNRDIRPILSDTCFHCHGPDKAARKAGLRLDLRADALKAAESGDIPIIPGKPEASELARRVLSEDASEMMPPPEANKPLTARQKELFRRWIAQGAEYQQHWSFLPLQKPAVPKLPAGMPASENSIDNFIRERLAVEKLMPASPADKTTLIRRVTLDLTGLPPTPAEVAAFLKDTAPGAYERVVDRLLKSPHYGERMAVDWLDAARYADTNGYQVDRDRMVYAWRDWVIRAFNENKRFDQFTIEQIAGDLLPNATFDQRIATGFHRNHISNEEGGIIDEEFLAEYTADRVETTATVWLGQTFNCARCHDHKFDPFTQRDFYSLKAFFHNISENGVGDYGKPAHLSTPPFVKLRTPQVDARLAALDTKITALQKAQRDWIENAKSDLEEWAHEMGHRPVVWSAVPLLFVQSNLTGITIQPQRQEITLAPIDSNDHQATLAIAPSAKRVTTLRIRCQSTTASAKVRWSELRVSLVTSDGKKQQLKLAPTGISPPYSLDDARRLVDGPRRTAIDVKLQDHQPLDVIFELDEPLRPQPTDARVEVYLGLEGSSAATHWQVDANREGSDRLVPRAIQKIAQKDPKEWKPADREILLSAYKLRQPEYQEIAQRLSRATQAREAEETAVPTALVMAELGKPRDTFILMRGEYDKRGTQVTATTPAILPPMRDNLPKNRLGLARWLVDPQNPLTPRVTVNRLWQLFFGVGLVKTAEDFGSQGEPPSHPELVDWLASEFVSSGWDVKAMVRQIVSSETYQQSSRLTADLRERDPENRLLARGPRFRLQGEFIRDQALAVSGLLAAKVGGPSVKPYHPPGLYEQVTAGTGTNVYVPGHGDDLHRRSLYTYWKRSVPNPAMLLFDAPFRETCTLRRARTNTPLQALNLLNDPTYVEAARGLAQRMLREGGASFETQLTLGYQLVLSRSPRAAEVALLKVSWTHAMEDFQKNAAAATELLKVGEAPADAKLQPAQLAAMTMIASTILNLDEAVTKE